MVHSPPELRVRAVDACPLFRWSAIAGLLLLVGCSGGSGGNPATLPSPPPGDGPQEVDESLVAGELTDANAELVARSSLQTLSDVVAVANIATAIAREYLYLVQAPGGFNPGTPGMPISQCTGSPDGFSIETNEVSRREFKAGFELPPGPVLHVALSNCDFEGVWISGFIEIAGITHLGSDPSGDGDWTLEAVLGLGPVEILHDNGTATSITDKMTYLATMQGGVLTTRITIAADPERGEMGGLNTQHYIAPLGANSAIVNHQFRPFRVRTVDDPNTGEYSLAIEPGPEGPSLLSRYTLRPIAEVLMEVETTTAARWEGGRPASYGDVPVAGEIRFVEQCDDCATLLATVQDDGVMLTVDTGTAITTRYSDWQTLLAPPPGP